MPKEPLKLSCIMKRIPLLAISFLMLQPQAHAAGETASQSAFEQKCAALQQMPLDAVADVPGRITSTKVVVDEPTPEAMREWYVKRGHTQGAPTPAVETYPAHCRVEGYMTPRIKFLLLLPYMDDWNNRFMLAACEGWCGALNNETLMPGLARGSAVATNDGGHFSGRGFDGVWAYNNVEARIDFAYRANHVTAQASKAIIKQFYGEPARYSYIAGFSKGGNAGLITAARYPNDFDGVFSKAPVPEYQMKNSVHFIWISKAVYPDGDTPVIDASKAPLLHKSVISACDGIDGLVDGVIDDPRKCDWDPGALTCEAEQDEASCLTTAQVEAVRKIYAPVTDEKGKVIFPWATDRGSEMEWPGAILPAPNSPRPSYFLDGARTGLKYMVFKEADPTYDWRKFDYKKERKRIEEMGEVLDARSTDLTAFKKRGGKMIVLHGWSDAFVSPTMSIDWFKRVQASMGGEESVAEFAQLYTAPGLTHGSGGNAPYVFDALTALESWVEKGVAPKHLIMSDEEGSEPLRTRPLYPYPLESRYKGEGDVNNAENYVPMAPGATD